MPGLYKIVGGSHYDSDAVRHFPGDTYAPTKQELAAFPDRFELVTPQETLTEIDTVIKEAPADGLMDRLDLVAIFIEKTNPGVVLKALADGRFTAEEALAAEMTGLERPTLIASLEAVIGGRIEPHPDNVLTLEELGKLPAIDDDQDMPKPFNVATATIDDVLAAVANGTLAADVALAQERGRTQPRKSLLAKLEAMVE